MKKLEKVALSAKKGKKRTAAEEFVRLQNAIERGKLDVDKALANQKKLVSQFNLEILPNEIALLKQLILETQHVLGFWPDKNLNAQHRQFMMYWVQCNLQKLKQTPFNLDVDDQAAIYAIQQDIQNVLQDNHNDVQCLLDDFQIPVDKSEASYKPGRREQQSFHQSSSDEIHPQDTSCREEIAAKAEQFSRSSINALFRQLARLLHPDLEVDEAQKAIKHEQMTALLKAREEQDVMTLFELWRAQGKALPSFGEVELMAINAMLKQQLHNVEREKDAALFENVLHGQIYDMFYRRNPQFSFLAFKNHKEQLQRNIQHSKELIRNMNTTKDLKNILRDKF